MTSAGGPRVKGVALRSALLAFQKIRASRTDALTDALLKREMRDAVRYGGIVASAWYPMEWYRDLHAAMRAVTGEGESLIREVERKAARADMTGVYSVVLKLLSPQALLSVSGRLFSSYYDTGSLQVVSGRTGHARTKWAGCDGWDRNIWVGAFASCEEMLEMAGAKNVRVHVLGGGRDGDNFADADAFWT